MKHASFLVTSAQIRAVALGSLTALVAVALGRADLLVLAMPMLVVATWAIVTRPRGAASVRTRLGRRRIGESESTALTIEATLPAGADLLTARVVQEPRVEFDPRRGWLMALARTGTGGDRSAVATVSVRANRWGMPVVGPVVARVVSPWFAYRSAPVELPGEALIVLPVRAPFDQQAPVPHAAGLLGVNRSSRPGGGSEFDTIRPFHPGDRLRRIHWAASARTGRLHVTSTFADSDSHVLLVVDAFTDAGVRARPAGRTPTSLDLTVRAAAALAEHYLRVGDRVAVRVVGARSTRLKARSGQNQFGQILDVLARIEPGTDRFDDGRAALMGLGSPSLVLVLTSLTDPAVTSVISGIGARGVTTVVVDTCPEGLGNAATWQAAQLPDGVSATDLALAWRIRLLARAGAIADLRAVGIPVVPWRGWGSLDTILRDVARRARTPRVARR